MQPVTPTLSEKLAENVVAAPDVAVVGLMVPTVGAVVSVVLETVMLVVDPTPVFPAESLQLT